MTDKYVYRVLVIHLLRGINNSRVKIVVRQVAEALSGGIYSAANRFRRHLSNLFSIDGNILHDNLIVTGGNCTVEIFG